MCHEYGWGVPKDMEVAAEHYSKAALDGNSSAMFNLASYFEKTANGRSFLQFLNFISINKGAIVIFSV